MLPLRREEQITGKQVPENILLNSHDSSGSYQMLLGLFRIVCQNGLVCDGPLVRLACHMRVT
ncbi:DUF932 domain-containing protein [Klebsiella oxytoca]|uniref:DUF932 domain-containing protein n=1 Tax=Klebsiella oxytoca TaxID=571 RepID=UPI003314D163